MDSSISNQINYYLVTQAVLIPPTESRPYYRGYVLLPVGHKLYGKSLDDRVILKLSVPFELTAAEFVTEHICNALGISTIYVGMWLLGFSTHLHYWPIEASSTFIEANDWVEKLKVAVA